MAARSEAEVTSLLVYKSPAWKGGVLYSCERALVDAEGWLETPRPNRDKREISGQVARIIIGALPFFANLGAVGEYRWCVCSSV
jgi:hypothetical protein